MPASSETPAEPGLHEMLRIMDVARTVRREQEIVARQFQLDEVKAHLRERLLASTEITGERLSAAEVDAAIDLYFAHLHTFHEPPPGVRWTLAHLYVRRGLAAAVLLAVGMLAAGVWGLLALWP